MDNLAKKIVFDPCCGGKMMWFDKKDSRVVFADQRRETMHIDHLPSQTNRKPKVINPDIIHDFTKMEIADDSFYHVVFDPPHVRGISGKSVTGFSYGSLDKKTWKEDLTKGFQECFRILKPYGTLIFKWNETDIPLRQILALTNKKPLYGHKSGKKAQTHWVAFLNDGF